MLAHPPRCALSERGPVIGSPNWDGLLEEDDDAAARLNEAGLRVLEVAHLLAQERGARRHWAPRQQSRAAADTGRQLFRCETAWPQRPTREQRLVESRTSQRHVLSSMRERARREAERQRLLATQQEEWRAAGRSRLPPRSRARRAPPAQRKEGMPKGGSGSTQRMPSGVNLGPVSVGEPECAASRDVEYLLLSLLAKMRNGWHGGQ